MGIRDDNAFLKHMANVAREKGRSDMELMRVSRLIRLDEDFFKMFKGKVKLDIKFRGTPYSRIPAGKKEETLLKEIETLHTGVHYSTKIGLFIIRAYCTKNIAGAVVLLAGEKVGTVVYSKKLNVKNAKKALLENYTGSAIYQALINKFEENLGILEGQKGSQIMFEQPMNMVWLGSTYRSLLKENKVTDKNREAWLRRLATAANLSPVTASKYLNNVLDISKRTGINKLRIIFSAESKKVLLFWEKYSHIKDLDQKINRISEDTKTEPVTICLYLSNILGKKERKGISKILKRCVAQHKNILPYWEKYKHVDGLEEKVSLIANDAELLSTTVCLYLLQLLSKEEQKGLDALFKRLIAEKSGVLKLWKKYEHIEVLKQKVILIAEDAVLSPITVCTYLQSVLSKDEQKGLSTLYRVFAAENKQIVKYWEKYSHVEDLMEKVSLISEDAGLSILVTFTYLLNGLSKGEKKGLFDLRQKICAERKDILMFWDKYSHIKNLEQRIRLIAEDAVLSPVTVCKYLQSVLSKDELKGLIGVMNNFFAQRKNIISYWEKYSHIADLEEKVSLIAEDAGLSVFTTLRYLSCVLGKKENKEVTELRVKMCAERKDILTLWNKYSHIEGLEARIRLIAEDAVINPSTVCLYLQSVISKDELKGIWGVSRKFAAENKQIVKYWEKYSHVTDLKEKVSLIAEDAELGILTTFTYLPQVLSKEERKGLYVLSKKLCADRKNILMFWDKYSHIKDLEQRIKLISEDAKIKPVSVCSYLLTSIAREDKYLVRKLFRKFTSETKALK